MQWSPDRNGGFSKADFAQLYLPPLMDPVYGFGAVNVEAQRRNPGSFLHWMRGMLVERRALPVLGVGEMEMLACPNPSVLAYVRSGEVADVPVADAPVAEPGPAPATPPLAGAVALDDWSIWEETTARTVPAGNEESGEAVRRSQAVLCVHNLSRFAQPAELSWPGGRATRRWRCSAGCPSPPSARSPTRSPWPLRLPVVRPGRAVAPVGRGAA